MPEPIAEEVIRKIDEAASLYHRLIVLVARAGEGKTAALREVRDQTGGTLINLNLEMSRRMLDLTGRQRLLQISRLLQELVNSSPSEIVLLDNTEMLFDKDLKQDPLRLFQSLSRNKTVVVAWNGSVKDRHLKYAEPSHPEYRSYPVIDVLLAGPGVAE
ncbi:MAG: BREX-3 system P-loop-containing protein BrxF [Thermodesulfobacteriota bacterium]